MQNLLRYLIPSLADIIFLVIFLLLSVLMPWKLLIDCDTGYHIKIGEIILQSFTIPKYDIFSFITPPPRWVAFEWLSEVIMAGIHNLSGLTGIVIFFAFLISITYYFLFKTFQKENINIIISLIIILLVIISSSIHWLARPHIFSLLLFVAFYYILNLYQNRDQNHLYFLPLIMLLWVNLHGAFVLGFFLLLIYTVGNLIEMMTAFKLNKNLAKSKIKTLIFITSIIFFVSFLNPNGYRTLFVPFDLISSKFIINHIGEFQSPNFHEIDLLPFLILLLFIFVTINFSRRSLNSIDILLSLLFGYMALYSQRNIPFFAIVMAPIVARQCQHILDDHHGYISNFFKIRDQNLSKVDKSARGQLWIALPSVIVSIMAITGYINYGFDENFKPVAAVDFLKREHIGGNMFNGYEFGDYIIYKAYPDYKVFIDGRADMYGTEQLKEYYLIKDFMPGWEKTLEKYEINFIFFDTNSPLSRFLAKKDDWKLIYSDKVSSIFLRNIPSNVHLIEKYKNVTLFAKDDY